MQQSSDTQSILDAIGGIPTTDYSQELDYIKKIVEATYNYTNVNSEYWNQQLAFNEQIAKCCDKNTELLKQILVKLDKCCKCGKCKNYEEKEAEQEPVAAIKMSVKTTKKKK